MAAYKCSLSAGRKLPFGRKSLLSENKYIENVMVLHDHMTADMRLLAGRLFSVDGRADAFIDMCCQALRLLQICVLKCLALSFLCDKFGAYVRDLILTLEVSPPACLCRFTTFFAVFWPHLQPS